jgi:hypothetical protein
MANEKKNTAEKFFREAGALWCKMYSELVPPDLETGEVADCGFWEDGSEKKAMKEILISLRLRAERKNIIWTKEEMLKRLELFIMATYNDKWISDHFSLRIINQSKTLIFNKKSKSKDATLAVTRETASKSLATGPNRKVRILFSVLYLTLSAFVPE